MNHGRGALEILSDAAVLGALARAWADSQPGLTRGYEQGGFIVMEPTGKLSVDRWPTGQSDGITVPEHEGCAFRGLPIVATFHTHPNTGANYLQEPGETDKRGVQDDANLKGQMYVGEFVIAQEMVYLVAPDGTVQALDRRSALRIE
jgi:hypothetical protein